MGFLTDEEIAALRPAQEAMFPSPIPTQVVASDEFSPIPQTEQQKQVEARIKDLADEIGTKHGLDRRRFLTTASGMAAAFLAMNDVYGPVFGVTTAEAQERDRAEARAASLRDQFIMDVHTHFLRDDTRIMGFVEMRRAVGRAGWNPALNPAEQSIDSLKYANWFKEVFLDSDTKVAMISGAPSDEAQDWFLTNQMKFDARKRINDAAGTRRAMSHAIFTPGQPGWLEQVDKAIEELKPDSFKGYTIGDNTNKHLAQWPWRMDDEKVVYPFYEKLLKAGHNIVCVHKGLFPPQIEARFPHLLPYARVDDVGKAAKDWPGINFVIYHSAYRFAGGGTAEQGMEQFERTGRVEWVSDLAEIPAKYGVTNVYGDLGQIFAQSTVVQPRLCAAMMGILVKGLGADHVVWGTDAVWTGSPQWQIEALRRLEIPEDLQRRFGFAPLGPADGPVKTAIFSGNSVKMYKYDQRRAGLEDDAVSRVKRDYAAAGGERSNLAYGYVAG
ncbi:amidohydrolase family protein [Paracraurococcus ruber]|uniref:Amidohydrolase n=1 Tax=Paracraurococcus ruber TaxID=77675 RepID=A0ABS1CWP7_9PROT|nr:amidohydrolase family protein [Paracraurococcus ruber]MBK1658950.1 amidohydrolase [Paracraurococcus ruber]TDG29415.1 amidohydrolase [Paracraurococcus ruber]